MYWSLQNTLDKAAGKNVGFFGVESGVEGCFFSTDVDAEAGFVCGVGNDVSNRLLLSAVGVESSGIEGSRIVQI